jgi:hypothetical protein
MYPAAAYKRMRNRSTKNQEPVLVTPTAALQTAAQVQDYFLCWDCEQLLRASGEDWVMRNCWQLDGTFPLQQHLDKYSADAVQFAADMMTPLTKRYIASKIKELDAKKLIYFGVSVFWRASAHQWPGKRMPNGLLGEYEDRLRPYLMGKEDLPMSAALWVAVPMSNDASSCCFVIEPARGKQQPGASIFARFYFLGIGFQFLLGDRLPKRYLDQCLAHGNAIARTIHLDIDIAQRWAAIAKGRALP